ncbi:MAG: ABC transporter ATP-binding protein [Negativicutes bacterium]|nr:ABC transporter ATP-binding protein [Negativicutes bacterium]
MLEIETISFGYKPDCYAIRDVSFAIAAGEFVAIAGRNGSGKTTLTRLIMALLKPAVGRVLLDGNDTAKMETAAIARHIGYVFQNPDRQIFRDTVAREIAYGPEQLGFSPAEVEQEVAKAMASTGLTQQAQAYPRTLSKGQKQRVAIASALAMRPRLLILDEPTSGQDATEKRTLMEMLGRLNSQGIAILLVTHDMELISRFARRVLVMADGSKVFDGSPAWLFAGDSALRDWGLRPPAAVEILRGLRERGVLTTGITERLNYYSRGEGAEEYA